MAEDTKNTQASSNNSLYIGAIKAMQSGTYFSGLIDDIQINNRAIIS